MNNQNRPLTLLPLRSWPVLLLLMTNGCGDSVTPADPAEPSDESPTPALIFNVVVNPSRATIVEGESQQLIGRVVNTYGRELTDRNLEWSSRDPAVVSVSSTGAISANLPGATWIKATSEEKSDSAKISVLPRAAAIVVTPGDVSLALAETISWEASVTDSRGDPVVGRAVNWSSSDESVASVVGGEGEALVVGSAMITAELDGATGTATVTVVPPRFISISAGRGHTCAIADGGRVYCWGANEHGQLGNGTFIPSTLPVRSASDLAFREISSGTGYTCGVITSGEAHCWGDNSMMELGNANAGKATAFPIRVDTEYTFSMISTSDMSHSCALGVDSFAYCWGYNRFGQVGNGSTADERYPIPVIGGLTFHYLVSRAMRTCGISEAGDAYCWGRGGHSQVGNSSIDLESCSNPCSTAPAMASGGIKYHSVSTGSKHTCGISTDGDTYCWGWNESGQLGIGAVDSVQVPTALNAGITFKQISASDSHTCGVDGEGNGYCWGLNSDGRLGSGGAAVAFVPELVAGDLSFGSMSTGWTHSCGLTTDGSVYCWGDNTMGQLGDGTSSNRSAPVQIRF